MNPILKKKTGDCNGERTFSINRTIRRRIIGGAAVLLTAPSSGKQLREKMKTNYDSFEETIKRLKSDGLALKDQLIKAAKESTDVIKDVGGELQTSIKKWQEEIKPHQQDLQKEIADIEEKIRQLEKTLQN